MTSRVSPTDRIRAEIDALFATDRDLGEVVEDVARLGARLILQTALEAEVTEFLGRERYARGDRARPGSRNGYNDMTVKTTAGPVTLERPKLRGADEAFASRLLGKHVTRTNALESLTIAGYVRGLSTRDVEACLADALGEQAALSKSTVSRVCEAIKTEFDTWAKRSLADVDLEYLYLDASHFRFHDGARAEPVMVAYSHHQRRRAAAAGRRGGLGGVPQRRGGLPARHGRPRAAPAAADGHRRRPRAVQRGRAGLCRQSAATLPDPPILEPDREGLQARPGRGQGRLLGDLRRHRRRARRRRGGPGPPARRRVRRQVAGQVPQRGRLCHRRPGPLTVHLRFPREHHKRIRHTNLIERTFGETRRRVKVIGRLPGERSCLSLVWAVLDRASRGWRGVVQTPANVRLLQQIRRDLFEPRAADDPQPEPAEHDLPDAVTPAA